MKLSEIIAIFSVRSRGRGWLGLTVLVLIGVAITVTILQIPSLLSARSVPTEVEVAPIASDELKAKTEQFKKTIAAAGDKVVSRSPFYPPKPKVPPPPPAPTRYTGPAVIGMLSDSVFFADGRRLSIADAADGGLAVLSISPPWSAQLRYNGAEFTVPLFEREPAKLNTGLGGTTSPTGITSGQGTRNSGRGGSGSPPATSPPATASPAPVEVPGSQPTPVPAGVDPTAAPPLSEPTTPPLSDPPTPPLSEPTTPPLSDPPTPEPSPAAEPAPAAPDIAWDKVRHREP